MWLLQKLLFPPFLNFCGFTVSPVLTEGPYKDPRQHYLILDSRLNSNSSSKLQKIVAFNMTIVRMKD